MAIFVEPCFFKEIGNNYNGYLIPTGDGMDGDEFEDYDVSV